MLCLRVFWLRGSLCFLCISVRVGVWMCALARTCVHIQQFRGILNFFSVLMSVSLRGSLYVCVFSWRGGLPVLQKRYHRFFALSLTAPFPLIRLSARSAPFYAPLTCCACDRQTQTDRHRATTYTELAHHCVAKIYKLTLFTINGKKRKH